MGQRLFQLFEREENTTSRWPIPPSPIVHSCYPSPENTVQSDDSEFLPYSPALASSSASSTIANPSTPLTLPRDTHNTNTSPARSNPPHSPNPSHHACPTAHPTTPGFASPSPRRPIPPSSLRRSNTLPRVYDSSPSAPSHQPPSSNHAAPAGPRLGPEAFG